MTQTLDPRDTLDTMLGLLGYVCEIKTFENDAGMLLQVYTGDKDALIGKRGELLEDLQFLLNRMLQSRDERAPKVQVDVEHYRDMKNDALAHRVRQMAEVVRRTGRPFQLEPMNSYERRIVHNALKDDPDVMSWSPPDDSRLKRITLKRRR